MHNGMSVSAIISVIESYIADLSTFWSERETFKTYCENNLNTYVYSHCGAWGLKSVRMWVIHPKWVALHVPAGGSLGLGVITPE